MGLLEMDAPQLLTIKPFRDQWIVWVCLYFLVFFLGTGIYLIDAICSSETIQWRVIAIIFAAFAAVVFLCAGISRLAYKGKLIITKDEIIKVHGKEEQFRIKREDLLFLGVRKVNCFVKLLVIIAANIGDICTDLVSFRFYRAETVTTRKFGKVLEMSSLTEEEKQNGMSEFVESITYRQVCKIARLLNIPVKKVLF